jgi:hypothetical protein
MIARKIKPDLAGNRFITKKNYSLNFVNVNDLRASDQLLTPLLSGDGGAILNEKQARLLGLFAAEGSYAKDKKKRYRGIHFTYSRDEYNTLAAETKELMEELYPGRAVHIYLHKTEYRCDIEMSDREVTPFFYEMVGEYSKKKQLSSKLVFNNESIVKSFINGWLDGDGTIDKYSGKVVGTTCSPYLAYQVSCMLNNMGINHSLYKNKPYQNFIRGKSVKTDGPYLVKIPYNEAKSFIKLSNKNYPTKPIKDVKMIAFCENYRIHGFLKISVINYDGYVYNLETENNSYVVNGNVISG